MQTFLPFPSFQKSCRVLDNSRLGKQRVECLQMLGSQWANHPATTMWRGFAAGLETYAAVAVETWVARGMRNTMSFTKHKVFELPWWFGNPLFHRSHQLRLIEKDANHYGPLFNPRQPNDAWGYVWPQESGSRIRKLRHNAALPKRLSKQRDLVWETFPHLRASGWHELLNPYGVVKAYGLLMRVECVGGVHWCLQSHTTGKEAKPVCYITEEL